ncbi:MAG: radical SAM protein [Candidatus Omnitrophica bacterium]|nr:radical SAM protein [Candidatus Omnitrophota bacterium]
MRNVLLIWTSFDIPNVNFVPLGLGYIASNMSKKYEVSIKDFALDKYSDNDLERLIEGLDPIAIGISFWELNYQAVKDMVATIKRFRADSVVILGGPSASARAHGGLEEIGADFAIKGEGEYSFELLLDLISAGSLHDQGALSTVPGLTYYDHRQKIYLSIPTKQFALEHIARPDYDTIRLRDYLSRNYEFGYFPKKVRSCPVISTRGCPYQCEFCSARTIHGTKVRLRCVESIVEEIHYLYHTYAIRGINIIDDNFSFHKEFVVRFCRSIISLKPSMPDLLFGLPNGIRMETLDDEMLDLMQKAGFESITIAPESGSDRTLKRMKKNITVNEITSRVSLIKKYRLKLFAFFIIGYPGETIEDIKKTIHFACGLPFDQITFSPFNPLPGTPIFADLLEKGEINEHYHPGNYFNITYAPAGITVGQMNALFRFALIRSVVCSPRRLFFLARSYSIKRIFNFAKIFLGRTSHQQKKPNLSNAE